MIFSTSQSGIRENSEACAAAMFKSRVQDNAIRADHRRIRNQHRTLNHVLKFPDVARPGIVCKYFQRFGGKGADFRAVFGAVSGKERLRQRDDVARPLSQGRDSERYHVKTVVEVFSEFCFLYLVFDPDIGGRNDPDVNRDGIFAAQPVHFAFLEDPQQLCLKMKRNFGNFIEQKRPGMRQFEFTFPVPDRPGKGAFFVSEKFALQKSFGKGGTVERNERLIFAPALIVNVAGKQFFAGPALTLNENGRVARSDFPGKGLDRAQDRVPGYYRIIGVLER